jgi:hypothetical protein
MNYRSAPAGRLYMCPGCSTPQQGPPQGGPVACPQCRAPFTLPDRSAMLGNPGMIAPVSNDPNRLQQLRMQDGRPRLAPPTLQAVLGGNTIQPGRGQEAIAIWQSLRARAAAGDVSASEDLTMLSILIAQQPDMAAQPAMSMAIAESAYDAAVLPRHKQEQLGRLVRLSIAAGDHPGATRYLSWMMPNAPELDADSEFRVSAAVVATLEGNAPRVMELLGPQKDAIPIVDSMDPMASVFRANAYERMGNPQAAAQILRELPDPQILPLVRSRFPSLQLCAQSAAAYTAATNQEGAARAAASAGFVGLLLGGILALTGVCMLAGGLLPLAFGAGEAGGIFALAPVSGIGLVMTVIGVAIIVRSRVKAKHAAWLRVNGLSLTARIMNAQPTGTTINDVPVMRFALQVAGPHGPYQASFTKLVQPHQVAMLMGQEVRVRANPNKLDEIVLEE